MKLDLKRTFGVLRRLKDEDDLQVYALVTSMIMALILLVFYLFAARSDEQQNDLGLGLLSLPVSVSPLAIFVAGFLLSVAIGIFMFSAFLNKVERLKKFHKKEVKKTKNELLALASHQLRTPASGVKQYLGMVLEGYTGDLKPEQKRMLKKAYSSNERQIETINQLLYVAQADAGELRLMPTTFNLTSKVRKVIEDLAKQADEKKIEVKFPLTKSVYVHGDKRFVRMIIENLVSNAIKYSYESSTVSLSVSRIGMQAIVKVQDQGVGIAEGDLPRLFLKFSRIENELSRSVGGSGVGLFLSQRLAKAHKGTIKVESAKSKGSTFTLVLPVASAASQKIKNYGRNISQKTKGVTVV